MDAGALPAYPSPAPVYSGMSPDGFGRKLGRADSRADLEDRCRQMKALDDGVEQTAFLPACVIFRPEADQRATPTPRDAFTSTRFQLRGIVADRRAPVTPESRSSPPSPPSHDARSRLQLPRRRSPAPTRRKPGADALLPPRQLAQEWPQGVCERGGVFVIPVVSTGCRGDVDAETLAEAVGYLDVEGKAIFAYDQPHRRGNGRQRLLVRQESS